MPDYSNIPEHLRQRGLFCCWRYEGHENRRTKIPYNPASGQRAQTNNPQSFVDFETARQMAQDYDGVGFLITGGLFVIDCDHCKNNDDSLTQPAADIVEHFNGAYVEWSPSGQGLHVIGYAPDFAFDKKKYWMNNRNIGVEVYISGATNRFMTLTGDIYRQGEISLQSPHLRAFLDQHMRRDVPLPAPAPTGESCLLDDEVVSKATYARNGAFFQKLWGGDCENYASQSEADLALCGILAFWCGKDLTQMDRLFRQSGLFREKWDRAQSGSTYGQITLEKAAADCKSIYKQAKKPKSPPSGKSTAHGKDSLTLADFHPEDNPRYPWEDIGSGRLFADYFKAVARYVPERKLWFCFDGKRWVPDLQDLKVAELAKRLSDELICYVTKIEDDRRREVYLNYAKKWMRRPFRDTIVKEAQSVYPISMDDFDADIYAFNCKNGTLHLDSMEFRPHSSVDMITKLSPVKYDPAVRCERWEQFISEIMVGDMDTAAFLQTVFGYDLTGETRYECLFVLYGRLTRNGKGTLCESVMRVMGDYGRSVKAETIAQKHNQLGNMPSEDVARLAGVRFANISEPDQRLEGSEQDLTLKDEFQKAKNQTGILNWLVDGYRLLKERGLQPSPAAVAATQEYRHDSDKISQFIEDWNGHTTVNPRSRFICLDTFDLQKL